MFTLCARVMFLVLLLTFFKTCLYLLAPDYHCFTDWAIDEFINICDLYLFAYHVVVVVADEHERDSQQNDEHYAEQVDVAG